MAGKSGNFGQCIKNLKCIFEIFLLNAYCALILRKNHANRLIAWFLFCYYDLFAFRNSLGDISINFLNVRLK